MFHVEHMHLLNAILFITILHSLGCKKPMSDPHLNDYIYQSLKQELGAAETKYSEIKKKHDEFATKSHDPSLSISDIKLARAKADLTLREMRMAEQKIKYWKLKLLSREEQVRISYLNAFNKGEEWNNDEEIQRYKKAQEWGKKRDLAKTPPVKKASSHDSPPTEGHESSASHGE